MTFSSVAEKKAGRWGEVFKQLGTCASGRCRCREVAFSGSSAVGNRRRFIRPYMEQHHFQRGIFASVPF